MTMPVSMLRQIRFDFVNLPFQAAECYLASVKPANGIDIWFCCMLLVGDRTNEKVPRCLM